MLKGGGEPPWASDPRDKERKQLSCLALKGGQAAVTGRERAGGMPGGVGVARNTIPSDTEALGCPL